MPSLINTALVDELVARDSRAEDATRTVMPHRELKPSGLSPRPLSPKMALLLGQAADSASTLKFLTDGSGMQEHNPIFQMFNRNPLSVIPIGVAGNIGYALAYELLKRKAPKIADTLGGLIGGLHMTLAGDNLQPDEHRGTVYYGTKLPK